MENSQIERVRSFNRLVTRQIGVLDDSYLGRGRPLGQARLLFEIGPEGRDLRALRERLGLDSGYLSRLLASLSAEGLVDTEQDPEDGRRRRVVLTQKGCEEWAAYDALSDAFAQSVLGPLGAAQRERLVKAMSEIEGLMTAAAIRIEPASPDSAEAAMCLDAYFAELNKRFETGFDPGKGGPSSGTSAAPHILSFLLARLDDRPVGCGVLQRLDARTGEIKRMWVAPDARGLGIARRLLEALEKAAQEAGLRRVRLDTNGTLAEAQALYRKAGYREIERYNDNPYADFWFEKELDSLRA
jgi:DNA-binding MarR family transcriptional regulator/GNAT superfamily N-acetyltransferase